jgi:hypothetical protein
MFFPDAVLELKRSPLLFSGKYPVADFFKLILGQQLPFHMFDGRIIDDVVIMLALQ